jgi:multiple antibiotic resistance protein
VKETSVTLSGVAETFLLLLVGIGPKLALVPLLKITAPLDPETKARVRRKMLATAATVAVVLILLGEVLRRLLHFSVESLSIAGGIVLLVLAIRMVIEDGETDGWKTAGVDPMRLAMVPLAVPYLLNPVGIVGLITISAEAGSLGVLGAELAVLATVLVIDVIVFRWAEGAGSGLDEGRMLVVEKIFAFLIAAIAVQLILDGLSPTGSKLRSISFSQTPDVTVEVQRPGLAPRLYLYDPKYKLQSEDATFGDGRPKKIDIDTMHAYRDAIRDNAERRVVSYAAILYPGPEARYGDSIEALQARPDRPDTLEHRLRDVLTEALDPSNDEPILASS